MPRYRPPSALSLALLLAVTAPLGAQEEPDLVTDRPDQTESAVVVPAGRVQIETGWLETESVADGLEITTTEAPGTLVRIGLAKRWELRLGWSGRVDLDVEGLGLAGGRAIDAHGDASVGFKVRLRDQNVAIPEMAILVDASLPVGDDAVTSDRVDPSVLVSMANEFNDRLALGYNLGVARESGPGGSGGVETETVVRHSCALGIGLAPRVGAFVELFGTLAASSGATDTFSADAGLTFLVRPNLQLDVAAGVGLNSAADDRFVLAGLTWRLPR